MRAFSGASVFGGALALVLAMVGCSDDDGAGSKDEFIAQLCAEFADCCEAAGRPADGAQCRAFYGAFAPPGYDQDAANDCLDEVRALGSEKCDMGSANTPSCGKVFQGEGTKQPGEECEDDADCAPSSSGSVECVTEFVDSATVQQCQVRVVGTEGSTPCVGTVDGNVTISNGDGIPEMGYLCDLADGLSCDSTSGACTALAAAGEACSGGFYSCVTSAYCDFLEGVCKERLAVGAACEGDDECQASAYCDPNDNTCAARRGEGEACTVNAECESNNCTNDTCDAANDLALVLLCGSD